MAVEHIHMPAPPQVYQRRRAKLAESLTRPMIILAGRGRARNYATNPYPFRAGSSYLYFGGPPVEGAAWIITPHGDGIDGCTLLRARGDFEETVWLGETASDEAIAEAAGIPVSALADPDKLIPILGGRPAAAVCPPCPASMEWMRSQQIPSPNREELLAIANLRLIKDEHGMIALRRAARIALEGHEAAMAATKPGRGEAHIAAAIMSVYTRYLSVPSFTPIVTVRGEALHSETYPNKLKEGRLLLVDAGAEEPSGYASDITRTWPVNGPFSPIQRHLYDTVLRAQREAIAACVPGKRFRDIHDLAGRLICEGLVEAELLRGDPAELTARYAHTLFFVHGLGHLVGLDVHDMEDFGDVAGYAPGRTRRKEFGNKYLRLDRDLAPGMVLTIEPGVYLVPAIWEQSGLVAPFADVVNRRKVDALLADEFGGIRIEDTIHVLPEGEAGPEVLTGDLPTDADKLAELVGA
jgi:Xaa-Pro aminopeptidase